MKTRNKIAIIVVLIIIAVNFGYNYIMTSGARDLQTEKPQFTTTAKTIYREFSTNSDEATKKYLNKAIQLSGVVTNTKGSVITLEEKVSCQIQLIPSLLIGEKVTIKGRVTGYDDLLEELKLDQCVIAK
jgi:hypothetical protein